MQDRSPEQLPRLITTSISHYCEKVRWALERLNIPYIEERHAPLFHRLATARNEGRSVPMLVTEAGTFSDSSDILQYIDGMSPVSAKLYPADPKLRQEVEKLEDWFDRQLGPSTGVWFYFYLLDRDKLILRLFCEGVEAIEAELFPVVFPCIREAMERAMEITPESAAESLDRINSIFETVNELLADGRKYLVGDSFSACDLTWACLTGLVLMPTEYGTKLPQLSEIPTEMAQTIEHFRATPAGSFALRLFREERDK
ncbi:glutathione S-transferase family protein [Planktothrix sp. FACHB-1355]|uniref:Glutathione S-transferase family protein n=1 Tax=Aerosakkonema funiforme FACHB-1375 TaxID=2949571 RepID=A0A926ZIH4_9CYAN|nr:MULTISPECIES: glutathione S-transferase family protein [Oscillatoriales]MBD2181776.1 glutathione S-transferase family protein [Aerosakkonema funiforme FACHB-1375]MBD3562964.1 glutathione S-transferase family protein [Planktothrix sp. FACHB-1355]